MGRSGVQVQPHGIVFVLTGANTGDECPGMKCVYFLIRFVLAILAAIVAEIIIPPLVGATVEPLYPVSVITAPL
jgi:hypothetical protein